MTVVNQTSRVPPLDAAAVSRLVSALDRENVAALYLIGSRARRTAGPLSDIDLAVLLSSSPASPRLRLELAGAAAAALRTAEVDLVLLNDASPLLRHRAARDGILLLDRDPSARVAFKANAIRDYLDTAPLRAELRRGIRARLREDRFGRP
jgi:predicted nucleotidyltransferase